MNATQYLNLPLVVDLDGTLIKTDTLYEAIMKLLKKNPLYLFLMPFWLMAGKASFKQKVMRLVSLNVKTLPYRQAFINYIQEQKNKGRTIVLATATNTVLAHQIAGHLKLFDDIIASDDADNIRGVQKLSAIQKRYPQYVYAGNESIDIPIWQQASAIIIISNSQGLLAKVRALNIPIETMWMDRPEILKNSLKLLRVHQWMKNILLFFPILTAHQLGNISIILHACFGFVALSLCASGAYIVNDLFDIDADRQHKRKKLRPFASGSISLLWGVLAVPILWGIAFTLAAMISKTFTIILFIYLTLALSYSLYIKKMALLDVIVLSIMYMLRIFAGGVIASILISEWLLTFSLFFFLSLAFVKRVSELQQSQQKNDIHTPGRGYLAIDLDQLVAFGSNSAYISIVIFALYLSSDTVVALYHHRQILWLCCPILLYWISRIWLITHRQEMHDDPVVFTLKDTQSYILGLLFSMLFYFAQ